MVIRNIQHPWDHTLERRLFTLAGYSRSIPTRVIAPPPRCHNIIYFCTSVYTAVPTGNGVEVVLGKAGNPNRQPAWYSV